MTQLCRVSLAMVGLLLVFAGSASAQYAYVSTSGGVSVINTVTNAVTATVDVGSGSSGVAVNPSGTFVYVANDASFDNTVSVISTATNAVTATVTVGTDPIGVAVNRAGTYVYVTNYVGNTVSVINAAINTVTATVSVGREPNGVAVNPAGTYVYVGNTFDGTVSVINTATNTVTATVNVGNGPWGVAVNPAGRYVYVANSSDNTVSVINTATNTVTATVNVGNSPRGVAVNPAGTYVYVANYYNTVSVIDAATNTVITTVNVPSTNGLVGIAVNPAGTSVYVPLFGGSAVSVIDTGTNTVTATVTLARSGFVNGFMGSFIGGPAISASIDAGGIVNSASYAANAPVAPGSLVSVFGAFPVSADAQANVAPLPTTLSGLSVLFNGIQAPLSYVSGPQANLQVPWELAGQTQASVTATVGGQTSVAQWVNLASVAPGVYTMNAQGQGAVEDALSGQLISPLNPAKAGATYISIYCTGLGPVTNQPATGAAPPAGVLSRTSALPTVSIGGTPATILFSGLAPTFVGLYQINVQVPAAVAPGNTVPLIVSVGGATANTVTIAVQPGS